jgi:NADH-quinone oxidoreductase subunit C
MKRLVDLTAIDRGGEQARFELVYRLQSVERGSSLRIHVRVEGAQGESADAAPFVDSVTSLWPAANWLEREVFDLFGIRFKGHPDLRRILLDEGFEGAPLRKDHPLQLERLLPTEDDL